MALFIVIIELAAFYFFSFWRFFLFIFLPWINTSFNQASAVDVQVSEGYGQSSFSNGCLLHGLSPPWSSSLQCFGVCRPGTASSYRASLASAEPLYHRLLWQNSLLCENLGSGSQGSCLKQCLIWMLWQLV